VLAVQIGRRFMFCGLSEEIKKKSKNQRDVGSGNCGTRIPEIVARSAVAGKASSKFR
jgi:hypothetical protein